MDLKLEGKRVLVTGASKGIGAAIARAFAAEGCALLLAARGADALTALADELSREHHAKVRVHPCDLGKADGRRELAKAAADADILINNAGAVPSGQLAAIDDGAWREGWELKINGCIELSRALYAAMKARGSGVIINIAGIAGERPAASYIAGTTANAAMAAFSRALGGFSLDDGIRVVAVNPGPVETDRLVAILRARAEATLGDAGQWRNLMSGGRFPQGRAAAPHEVADLAVFLASPRAAYISGTVVTIDGGITARNTMG